MSAFRDPEVGLVIGRMQQPVNACGNGSFAAPPLGGEILKTTAVRDDLRLTMRWHPGQTIMLSRP